MKKIFSILSVALLIAAATSCTSVKKTATVVDVNTNVSSKTTADLIVSQEKITFNYKVPKKVRRAGSKTVYETAVAEALKANGNADVLVHAQYVVKKKRNKIKEITVTGFPAKYTNFKVTNDK